MPLVAIVGRPNVGKSTLFNRLVGYRKAITTDEPGVTRDLNYGEVHIDDVNFTLVDTGGFEHDVKEELTSRVREQVELAIEEADLILCIMDGRDGLMPADIDIVDMLRVTDKPAVYVVNKVDSPKLEYLLTDFFKLGVDPLIALSAEHKFGVGELIDEIRERIPVAPLEQEEGEEIRIAVLGRPNVGKSTLVNRILGFERAIVTPVPGTTRDVIDTAFKRDNKSYRIIDTAGIRRKSRISRRLEQYSVMSAIRCLERCNVAILMIDALEGVTAQDARIGGLIADKGKGCVILVNKWDLVVKDTDTMTIYERGVREKLFFLDFAPILFVSARTGKRVERVLFHIDLVARELKERISTSTLNRIVKAYKLDEKMPSYRGRKIKIYYITQVGIKPPTFVAFVNYPQGIKETHRRFLINSLREGLGLKDVPLRLNIRRKV